MDDSHTLNAIAYVELNPVRAGMIDLPWDYTWSSCRAHCEICVADDLLNLDRWRSQFSADYWRDHLKVMAEDVGFAAKIRNHTQSGSAMGDEAFRLMVTEKLKKKVGG
tara:strand:- start:357 stop:680 length:324 start_codon:yes stop_codon:yes gene_type:complete